MKAPRAAPACRRCFYPTSYLKSRHLDKACALITDGRFSAERQGCRSVTFRPKRLRAGDRRHPHGRRDRDRHPAALDPPHGRRRGNRRAHGRTAAFPPAARDRRIPASLGAYAKLVSSADKGAVRIVRRRIKPDNTMNTNTTTRTEGQQPGPCITGSQALLESFLREGVDTLFGYPGGAIIPRLRCAFRLPRPAAPHPCPP